MSERDRCSITNNAANAVTFTPNALRAFILNTTLCVSPITDPLSHSTHWSQLSATRLRPIAMAVVLALLSPFGGIVSSLLPALAVCYAAVYGRLYDCCFGAAAKQSCVSEKEAAQLKQKAVKTVNMLGLHVADLPGCDIITDQQNDHQQAVMQLFRAHGHRNDNFHATFCNPEMQVLLLPGIGCMVYTVPAHWGLEVVAAIGDPVCELQHDLLMLQTFKAVFPAGGLIDVSKGVASLWAEEEAKQPGPTMTVTDMGTQTIIDLQKYSFDFNKRTKLIRRKPAAAAARAGLIVEEVTAHNSAAVKEQVQQLAAEWQQGKEVTDDLKVFSRIVPFQHLGREKDVRVFIARTLEPGEEASTIFTVAKATQQLEQQKAAAAKAAATAAAMTEDQDTLNPSPAPRSEQQRTRSAKRALWRQQQKQRWQQQQQQHQQQQQESTTVADGDCTTASPPPPPSSASASATPETNVPDLVIITCDTQQLPDKQQQQKQKQQQQPQPQQTASSTAAGGSNDSSASSASSHIHACVILDPIYQNGEVVGYLVQRTFVSPRGVKDAAKLVLKEVMGLLKAEGRAILNHGLAPAHSVKPGDYHGFTDCAWMRRSFQLCWEYGNSVYAFQNLALAKSSWGGGYSPEDDSFKFKEAVTLNRRFVLLPPSFKSQLGHGPLLLLVFFRHTGLLGDPWQLFAFWRYW